MFNKVINDYDRHNLVSNIVGAMSGIAEPKKNHIVNRQLCHFFRADAKLGMAIATGLRVNVETVVVSLNAKHASAEALLSA